MKRYMWMLPLFCLGLYACGGKETGTEANENTNNKAAESGVDAAALGEITFKAQCALCHGKDGKLGASGAKDLTVSTLSQKDAINLVSYGRGGMVGYKGLLTQDEIENVVAYIETLRKK